jgi:glutathione S-transferase
MPAEPSLTLHFHPLASFCHKVLIALYENETPFEPHIVDLGDPTARAAFSALWPIAKMPVLVDARRGQTCAEASIIIEYLAMHHPGRIALLPGNADAALEARALDRFYDLYVNEPMAKVVTDMLRPEGKHDALGVEQARALLVTAYGMIERQMTGRRWAIGDEFSLADCAAAPALYYAHQVLPLGAEHPTALAYRERLMARPSFARVLAEAEPYLALFPPNRAGGA